MVTIEFQVLGLVAERLEQAGIRYMVTGSMALAYYATPRMTRDIDIVVALALADLDRLQSSLAKEFYFDRDACVEAIRHQRLFNLMHFGTSIKIDLVIRKESDYRKLEFDRRLPVTVGGVTTWIVTREDLILSKLEWSKESSSELQRRDIRQLLAGPVDWTYLDRWARVLGVQSALQNLRA